MSDVGHRSIELPGRSVLENNKTNTSENVGFARLG